ncbi:hypothetical protein ACN38_g13119, partial [Penicillium nordicum]
HNSLIGYYLTAYLSYKDSPTPKLAAKRSANLLQIDFRFTSYSLPIHFRSLSLSMGGNCWPHQVVPSDGHEATTDQATRTIDEHLMAMGIRSVDRRWAMSTTYKPTSSKGK